MLPWLLPVFSPSCLLRRKNPAATCSHLCDTLYDPTGSSSHGPNLLRSCAKQILPLPISVGCVEPSGTSVSGVLSVYTFQQPAVLGGIPLVPRSRLAHSHDVQCEHISGYTPEVESQNTGIPTRRPLEVSVNASRGGPGFCYSCIPASELVSVGGF